MGDLMGRDLGPYHILERIGAGGMANVYKAYHAAMDRYVAVKVLPEQMCADPELRERFAREAKIVAALEHTHILPVHDYGQAGNQLYLVMRYIKAGTLKDRISAGPLDLAEVNHLFRQVGSALDYAHRLGIVHRDVKPSNVLLDDEGGCYLTDFGLAKILESSVQLTASGVGLGTPAYMSPEQGQGDKADARSDIYALGVVLYEMIAGQAPYQAETPMAVVLMHITAPLPPLRDARPDVPEEVERVILKAMAKDPDDRFQTVREMTDAFDEAVAASSQAAPAVAIPAAAPRPTAESGPPPRAGTRPMIKPRRLWAALGAVALSALCLAGLLVTARLLPFRVQIRDGQLELVRRVATTPAAVWSPTPQETKVALVPPTATAKPARPTETPTATWTPTPGPTEAAPTATPAGPAATATAPPTAALTPPLPTETPTPQPTPGPATHVRVSLLALYENSAGVFAWSPQGKTILCAGYTLRVFDVTTAQETLEIRGPTGQAIALSPDGTVLATAAYDGVKLWDTSGWGELRALPGSQDAKSVAFSPDGTLLAAGTGSAVKLWDVASGSELRTLPGSSGRAVAFSPDGTTLAASGGTAGQDIKLWDVASGSELPALQGHTNWINGLAFSPDGTLLASASVDHTVRLWDVAQGRQVRVLSGHTDQVEGVAFSPDGTLLASASWDLTVKLWDVASGQELASLTGHTGWVKAVAFAPDGATLASGSDGEMRLWLVERATAAPEPTPTLSVSAPVATPVPLSALALSPANAAQVSQLQSLDSSRVDHLAWSPDGRLLAAATSGVHIYDAQTWQRIYTLDRVQWTGGVAFSPDGATLAVAAHDGVRVYDTSGWGELRALPGSQDTKSLAFSPDGTLLATGTGSAVKLWDVASGGELRTLPGSSGRAVAFSPDGTTLAASGGTAGQDIKLWDVASGSERPALQGHTNWINGLAFSPDGTTLASASVDHTVRLWDVAQGRQVRVLSGHTDQVESVSFSPDGSLLASCSWDLTVKLWDVASGGELASLTGHTGWIKAVAFAPDGATLVSSAETTRVWGVRP